MDDELPDLQEVLGISDFISKREFGRERGNNPTPTEAQIKAIDKLAQKLLVVKSGNFLSKSREDDEELVNFDIKSKTRIILFESKVLKKSFNAVVSHTAKRQAFLLNDVLLITSIQTAGGLVKSEKLNLHQVFYLNQISISDLAVTSKDEDVAAFEIRTDERPFQFIAESESDKKIWLEELEAAIFCILASNGNKQIGWQHRIVRSSIFSAALRDDVDQLNFQISRCSPGSLDDLDDSGMNALHWAALFGNIRCVQILLNNGCDINCVNAGLNSALLLAACRGNEDIVNHLIIGCANIHIRNIKDLDCLSMAVLYGNKGPGLERILTAIHLRGVDLNKRNSSGATPLHECAAMNIPRPILCLVDLGAEVNIKHGRLGLTPLQLACSIFNPDPETVRSLLDKGAHPNWRDTAKRSAFDMALYAHKEKFSSGRLKILMDEGEKVRAPTAGDFVAEFSQVTIPVLLELCRRGGRFSEEALADLKPSFKEAIMGFRELWIKAEQPPQFEEFIAFKASDSSKTSQKWVDDSASKYCMLCVDTFTYSNRRHHCRFCGVLCCDLCSTKKLQLGMLLLDPMKPNSPSSKTSSTKSNGTSSSSNSQASRVCDGCFNSLLFECDSWKQAKKKLERLEAEQKAKDEAAAAAAANLPRSPGSSLFRIMNSSSSSSTSSGAGGAGIGRTASSDQSAATLVAASQAMKALEERGAKISEVAEKSEQLTEAASDFHQMTKILLKQQQNKLGRY